MTGSSPAAEPVPDRIRRSSGISWGRRAADRLATWLVTVGGMAIVLCVLGILVFILIEVFPLALPAAVEVHPAESSPVDAAHAIALDEYRSTLLAIGVNGVRVMDRDTRELRQEFPAPEGARFGAGRAAPLGRCLAGSTPDGRVVSFPYDWDVSYDADDRRVVTPVLPEPAVFEVDPAGQALRCFTANRDEDGSLVAAAQTGDGAVVLLRETREEDMFAGGFTATQERSEAEFGHELRCLAVDREGRHLFGGTSAGRLAWWEVEDGELTEARLFSAGGSPVTAVELLLGDQALLVGQEDGTVSVWFRVREEGNRFRLARIRDFPAHPSAIRHLAVSQRNKGFLAQDDSGQLGLYYSTSGRVIWRGDSPLPGATAACISPKADGMHLHGAGRIAALDVENPHPEISFGTLFGKVWYEDYDRPTHVWQSTGGEPKLSLVPLLFGTIKGTLMALLIAIPLGVLGAVYTSYFLHHRLRRIVRPAVEVMASLPSVVLGFLAGLWLAPRVEEVFPALVLSFLLIPIAVLLAGAGWQKLPTRIRGRLPAGAEIGVFLIALVVALGVAFQLNDLVEAGVFGGDYRAWLRDGFDLPYDQRNAVVVGLAMGFAVIPIIFSISDDALTNVPRNLVAGSLAMGADRWQTVTRVVLPTASPGIFSATIIGFGRAIGETMIVLMATGNTAIMDWNPFNGLRTLSANIAVEIPEAPYQGTLYRTLFLSALLLFVFTFVLNTLADLVRHRLRAKFARL